MKTEQENNVQNTTEKTEAQAPSEAQDTKEVIINNGADLDEAIRTRKICSDRTNCFEGKEIEIIEKNSTLDVKKFKLNVFCHLNGYSKKDFQGQEIVFTGRKIWAYAGAGYSYEVIIKATGEKAWFSGQCFTEIK